MKHCGKKVMMDKYEAKKTVENFKRTGEKRFVYHCCICNHYHLTKQENLLDEPIEVIGDLRNIFIDSIETHKTYNLYKISNERTLHHVKIEGIKYGFVYNRKNQSLQLQLIINESEKQNEQ